MRKSACYKPSRRNPMKDETDRPLAVLVTQGVLLLSSVFFSCLLALSVLLGEKSLFAQILYTFLLVAAPATALVAIIKKLPWGRQLAMFSMMFIWAFALKTMWATFGGTPEMFGAIFRHPLAALLFFGPTATLLGLPYLFWKLGFSSDVEEFFSVPDGDAELASGDTFYIGDTVAGFDESMFDRETELTFKE